MIALLLAASLLDAGPSDKLALRPAADFTIPGLALAGTAVTELLKSDLAPAQCGICGRPGGADGWFRGELAGWIWAAQTNDKISNVWVYAVVPVGALAASYAATGPSAGEGAGLRAAVVTLESAAVAGAMVQSIKFVAARQRPYVAYLTNEYAYDSDSRLSLPSGHTAWATAFGVSAAMTATLQESPAAPWLWAAAGVASVSTGMLRMMADKHYFSDVLTGAAIGGGCGVLFPLLHRRGSALSVSAQGSSFAVSGAF